jgi:hypothetical protein
MTRGLLAPVLLAAACGTSSRPPPAPPPPAIPQVQIERVRDELQVTPLELVFSGVRGETHAEEAVALRNVGSGPLSIGRIEVVGRDPTLFKVSVGPRLPLVLAPGSQMAVTVEFLPPADSPPGVRRALLRVLFGPRAEEGPPVDLAGLVTVGRRGDKEPALARVLDALGFHVETGAEGLRLPTSAAAVGEEIRAGRFRRARPTAVSLYPVARYASDDRVPYGIYTGGEPAQTQPLAAVAAGNGQTLNPDLEVEGRTTFDPGDAPFGIFENAGHRPLHTDDALNGGRHAARIYPLASRAGGKIPNAYVVAFDEDGDGDYQDCVFVIWNVIPAT